MKVLLILCAVFLVFICPPAYAASTQIVAQIPPVRCVVVSNGKIIEVSSNTKEDISPVFTRDQDNMVISPDKSLLNQYRSIIKQVGVNHYGVIYRVNKITLRLQNQQYASLMRVLGIYSKKNF